MNWENFLDFKLNGIKVTLWRSTKRHKWQLWFNARGTIEEMKHPQVEFTEGQGNAIVKFLKHLEKVQNANSKQVSSL